MMKQYKRLWFVTAALTLAPMLAGLILWNRLPETMATHWGADGTADGWSSKAFAVFGPPCILVAVHCLCLIITAKDNSSKDQSRKALNMVFWILPVTSWFCNGMVYANAIGKNLIGLVPVFMGLVFVIMGNYMPKVKQNRTLGIKIPWTLANEENWNKTHRFAGRLWVAGGVFMAVLVFLPQKWMIAAQFALILLMVAVPVIYSYCLHRKQKKTRT